MPYELVSTETADCGCVEEKWIVCNLEVTIHYEPDQADAFFDAGDWDWEMTFPGTTIDEMRNDMFAYVENLPIIA